MLYFSMTASSVGTKEPFYGRVIFHDGTFVTSPRGYQTEDEAAQHAANLIEMIRKGASPLIQNFIDD